MILNSSSVYGPESCEVFTARFLCPFEIVGSNGAVSFVHQLLCYERIRICLTEIMYQPVILSPFAALLLRESGVYFAAVISS